MKNKKFLSVLLCLALLASLPVLPGGAAAADGSADNGMKISKTATANKDGSFTITLEAFATGSKTTTVHKKDIPTDIILVLDQSGSTAADIGQVQYTAYTGNDTQNKSNYKKRHNGGSFNLWHKLPDGSYVSVSVTLQQTITYNQITKGRNDNDSDGYTNYWENKYNLYTYVNKEIKKVIYTRERDWFWENWNCKYALEDGTILNQNNEGSKYSPIFQNTDDGHLYLAEVDESQNVYTYTYTDARGVVQTIGTSTGADTKFTPAFYQRSTTTSGGGSRLSALKSAADAFIDAVAEKAVGNPAEGITSINHRIAVVGFASESGAGNNTELLSIAGNNSGSVGVAYNSITDQNLKDVLQSMDKLDGREMVNAAINALAAGGATRTDLGLDMAQRILNANPVPAGETRNRVVIVFTDGSPTNSNGFQRAVANSAISTANAIKAGGTTVYSIGIFSGADASAAGKKPDEDYYEDYYGGPNYTEAEMSAACNWFMQQVSSNNGTPKYPSYYLSAGDSASLNSIFQQITNQIETGGAETTLGSETIVKDIISPYFTLPVWTTARDIKIDTYACTGKNGDTYTWSSTSGGNGGASATVDGDQVSVTGFNFSDNWCGTETNAQGTTTYRGNKLVISFTVDPKNGFLGGNDVITNASAGIYEDGSDQIPVMTFEQPKVNVPTDDVTVTAQDKNVYLLGEVTAEQLKTGATVIVEDVKLDLSKANDAEKPYGLEPWQTAYVDIKVEVKDKDGNVISDKLKNLTNDTTYTVEVTVSPKTDGKGAAGTPATPITGKNAPANINVFKPELTFKDSTVEHKKSVLNGTDHTTLDDYFENVNRVGEDKKVVWKHEGATLPADQTMTGAEPTLDLTYTPEAGKIDNNIVESTTDIPVKVEVKIGTADVTGNTAFVHQDCTSACGWTDPTTPGAPAFLLHVKDVYADLTITKSGANETADPGQSFLFTVTGPEGYSTEVIVVGNRSVTLKNLKIGTYTVTEDTSWSWRYTPDKASVSIKLKANETNMVTINNMRNEDKWLDGNVRTDNKFTGTAATTN